MASSTSPEASEIRRRGRQRLIGAVAIALLLIVFVPMLLDSEPRKARDEPKLDIPPRDNAPALPAPVNAPAAKAPAAVVEEPKKADVAAKVEEPKKAEPPVPTAKVAVAEPKAAPPAKPAAAAKREGYAVQVGAFADEAKLQHAREKLAAAKIESYTEAAGNLTRLRVGPFPTRDAAEKAAGNVRKAVGEAKVVSAHD